MAFLSRLLGLAALFAVCAAQTSQYVLKDRYDNTNFFEEFQFFTDSDPTGNISYVNADVANEQRLAGFVSDAIFLGVDTQGLTGAGALRSTRMASTKTYTLGLFVADIAHMPEGCGTWPALWSFGADWPNNGEIDVIENVNSATNDRITLHTSPGCTVTNTGSAASTQLLNGDCNADEAQQGCSQNATGAPYGSALNAAGGAVWAWEWAADSISVWSFGNSSAEAAAIRAATAQGAAPDQSGWGTPAARFVSGGGGGCDFSTAFQNHQLTVNTEVCGVWAGADETWSSDPVCGALAPTCGAYAAAHPEAFADAYWVINSITVYQQESGGGSGKRAMAFQA